MMYYKDRVFESVTFSKKENSLVTFFLQLTRYLQQTVGTVAAIDLNAYDENQILLTSFFLLQPFLFLQF